MIKNNKESISNSSFKVRTFFPRRPSSGMNKTGASLDDTASPELCQNFCWAISLDCYDSFWIILELFGFLSCKLCHAVPLQYSALNPIEILHPFRCLGRFLTCEGFELQTGIFGQTLLQDNDQRQSAIQTTQIQRMMAQ